MPKSTIDPDIIGDILNKQSYDRLFSQNENVTRIYPVKRFDKNGKLIEEISTKQLIKREKARARKGQK